MKTPAPLLLPLALLTFAGCATTQLPPVQPLGNNTYQITNQANSGFGRDVDKLKQDALDQAAAYCASQHKQIKVVSATAEKPKLIFTGYAKAKVVFKALAADDPELRAPVAPPMVENAPAATPAAASSAAPVVMAPPAAPVHRTTDEMYNDLMKLDDLRKRGILTEDEFQAEKKKILDRSD